MSHSTIAATRQNEMNENITLLTTTTCAARPNLRPDHEPLESNDDAMEEAPGGSTIPPNKESRRAWRRLASGVLSTYRQYATRKMAANQCRCGATFHRLDVPFQSGRATHPVL